MCILHILNSFIHLHSLVSSCYSYISVMQYRQSKLTVGIFFAMQYLVINTTVKGYIKNGLGNSVYTFGVNNTPNLCVLVLFLSLRNFIISICYCCIFKLGTVFSIQILILLPFYFCGCWCIADVTSFDAEIFNFLEKFERRKNIFSFAVIFWWKENLTWSIMIGCELILFWLGFWILDYWLYTSDIIYFDNGIMTS